MQHYATIPPFVFAKKAPLSAAFSPANDQLMTDEQNEGLLREFVLRVRFENGPLKRIYENLNQIPRADKEHRENEVESKELKQTAH